MILSKLSDSELRRQLCHEGLVIRTGPFNFRIASTIKSVENGLKLLYGDYPLAESDTFVDFTVSLTQSAGLRRFWRPQVNFTYDGQHPFAALPLDHAFPLLEWAMNWCISTQALSYLALHAAVIEKIWLCGYLAGPTGVRKKHTLRWACQSRLAASFGRTHLDRPVKRPHRPPGPAHQFEEPIA